MKPQPGYGYAYTGRRWGTSSDEDWDTEMFSEGELRGAVYVGSRNIDGSRCAVFRLRNGSYVAQMEHMVRNPRPNHGNDPHSMTWGVMPDYKFFKEHLKDYYDYTSGERQSVKDGDPKGYVFYGDLVGEDAEAGEHAAEGITGVEFSERRGKLHFEVETVAALHEWITSLVHHFEDGNEAAGSLASGMMAVLGFEWI